MQILEIIILEDPSLGIEKNNHLFKNHHNIKLTL